MSHQLTRTAQAVDLLIAIIGRTVIWLSLLLVLLQFAVVLLRYVFGIGSIWLSESVIYTHATLFLLAAAWTLQQNGHARVDVFYADASARNKAVVDLLGALLLLLPFMAAIIWYCAACGALLVDPGAFARRAVCLCVFVEDAAHPAIRVPDGAARPFPGDLAQRCCSPQAPHHSRKPPIQPCGIFS